MFLQDSQRQLITGEWWNKDPIDVLKQATFTGAGPAVSNAYTINGQPGDLYRCSNQGLHYTCQALTPGIEIKNSKFFL